MSAKKVPEDCDPRRRDKDARTSPVQFLCGQEIGTRGAKQGVIINDDNDKKEYWFGRYKAMLQQKHGSVKVNTAFNGEFMKDKRANKSIITKNSRIYRCANMREWYEQHVVEPILASLEEFQKLLNLADIEIPISFKDIPKFENLNNISINVYSIEDKQLQDSRNDNIRHFAWTKNLSHLVSSQISGKKNKKYFCDRLHYFRSCEKLQSHEVDCQKINDCAIQLSRSISGSNSATIITGNECRSSSYAYQQHDAFSIGYYVRCAYALSSYHFRREDCDTVSKSDYAANIWKRFSIRTLNNKYSNLYLKTDVLLLADIFKNFCNSCVASYCLDPAYYYTSPGFTWDAMLKHTRVRCELFTDINMVMFIERGLSQCFGRYAQTNNKYISTAENLIAVEMRKLEVKFNKPIYVGMCILDISKACLNEFHHEYMSLMYCNKCKIMYTDTDSLIYYIECDNVYETMKRDIVKFDTTDYPADNMYGMPLANKKVAGLIKDEKNDMIMTEFVGFKAKMYAVRGQEGH
ncbi:PREDICTED: uncharacterized protein LOC105155092 [Acromyrmex echinatior]|uniref:uncharacterized protein LOC105155092 n=1 Tax=Acromyrmex echinatior TaxID=103372 RepID=UPI000580C889|nr:PREDICTED: uncharacterized protein LOC105155092 [Acromyrmex echinatior]